MGTRRTTRGGVFAVTNPERFEPLIPYAERLLDDLERTFLVTRRAGDEVDKDFDIKGPSRTAVRLEPDDEDAAQISFAFSTFPGLSVRVGYWYEENFPHCGCDACDETTEGLQEEIEWLVSAVISGGMNESVEIPVVGHAWQTYVIRNRSAERSGASRITRKQAVELVRLSGGRKKVGYAPWPKRNPSL